MIKKEFNLSEKIGFFVFAERGDVGYVDAIKQEDVKEFIRLLKEDYVYSIKKKFWDDYEEIVRYFIKFCKNKNYQEYFMALLDKIVIDKDHISVEDLDKLAGEKLK